MNVRPVVFLAALLVASSVLAQDPSDPPNRVARVSVLEGNVSLEPAGVNQFSAAELNYPLTAGDRIYADNQAFSELQTSGLALRLANGADLTVTTLSDFTAQFGLAQGSLRLRTRDLDAPQGAQAVVEVDTVNGAILVQRPGDIRVDSYPQNDTSVVTVTSGQVEVTGNGFDQVVYANQALRLVGNPTFAEPVQLLPADALDRFDYERERAHQQALAASSAYVDSDMIGAADLSNYGDWNPNPGGGDYGAAWFPRAVPAGWSPYSNGHWAWVVPWGWTWVEAEPWGFAPFHYGRWAQFGGRWGWVPGPPPEVFTTGGRPFHPVYSPALVAFVGGSNFSVALGFGGGSGGGVTAWFPLGPRETYTPWYHASPGYVNRVNVTNIYNRNVTEVHNTYINRTVVYNTTINNTYINRSVATVAVPQQDFAAGRAVAQSQPIRFNASQRQALTSAPILPHPLVTPAARIATPQAPPRVVPPSTARPVLETRAGGGGSREGVPTNTSPVNPETGSQRSPGQPAVKQASPSLPVQAQRQVGQEPTSLDPATREPVRGSFPVQREHQPAPAAAPSLSPSPAASSRPTSPQPLQAPSLQSRPLPRPPDQPRALVNHAAPPPPSPSFGQQQRAIERTDPGRPLGPQQLDNLRNNRPAGPASQPERAHPAPSGSPASRDSRPSRLP